MYQKLGLRLHPYLPLAVYGGYEMGMLYFESIHTSYRWLILAVKRFLTVTHRLPTKSRDYHYPDSMIGVLEGE